MIDLLVRSLVLAALGLLVLGLTRRRSASVRHLVALSALTAMLALPLFGRLVPPARLPVLPAPPVQTTVTQVVVADAPVTVPAPVTAAPKPTPVAPPFPWALLWIAGTGVLLLRWAAGWVWLALRLRRAERIEGLDAPLTVVESDAFALPLVAWTPRAQIVFPKGWREWPADRLDVVLRHEAAHVRRGDGLGMLVSRLAVALFWPNPLVWTLARAEARLAERATDDLVVSEGVPAARYAHELLALARPAPLPAALPALGMARPTALSHRVEMILKAELSRTSVAPRARLGAALAALGLALPVAVFALGPQASPAPPANPTKAKVLLECKLLQTGVPFAAPVAQTVHDAFLKGSPDVTVISSPRLFTLDGMEARITMKTATRKKTQTTQGRATKMEETSATLDTEVRALPTLTGKDRGLLRLSATVGVAGGWRTTRVMQSALGDGGWTAMGLPAAKESRYFYTLLVRTTIVKDEAAVPTAKPAVHRLTRAPGSRPPGTVPAPPKAGEVVVLVVSHIVRTADEAEGRLSSSSARPTFALASREISIDDAEHAMLLGQEMNYGTVIDHRIVGAHMRVSAASGGGFRLGVTVDATDAFHSPPDWMRLDRDARHLVLGTVDVRPNGWARFWLTNRADRYQGLQMLVQVKVYSIR